MSEISRGVILKDPYEVLGVARNAAQDDIAKAYREAALKYHPDRNPGDKQTEAAEKFKEVAAAFEILNNPQKRAEYDRFGTSGGPSPFGGRPWRPFRSPMEDFVSQFFGDRPRQSQGENIVVELEIGLEEVYSGGKREVKFNRHKLCPKCNGEGGEYVTCSTCNGSGTRVIYGSAMTVKTSCAVCNGEGKVLQEHCSACNGGLADVEEHAVQFDIPRGVENGMRFGYQGLGEPIPQGSSGNLYLVVKVKPHDLFERQQGGNVLCKVPVSYAQLVLGDEIDVPTLNGVAQVKIPAGTQPHTKFKLQGLGLPIFNARGGIYKHGDEIVQVDLEVPANPEGRYRELIVELSELEKQNVAPKKKIFGEKAGV